MQAISDLQGSMKPRRKARFDALQILYQVDLNQQLSSGNALDHFQEHFAQDRKADAFTEKLVNGVVENLEAIDNLLQKTSDHWRKERMGSIDRNILRLGIYELQYCNDIPATVTINEMVEVAKRFGDKDSPAFVNGILDKIKCGLDLAQKAP